MNIFFVIILCFVGSLSRSWYDLSLKEISAFYPGIVYREIYPCVPFCYDPFLLSIDPDQNPSSATFQSLGIITIPHGRVTTRYGFVTVDDCFIKELAWKGLGYQHSLLPKVDDDQVVHVSGSVAVIGQLAYFNYFHWLTEVMARLALLDQAGIEYDWLYVEASPSFAKQMLELFGVDPKKIIQPCDDFFAIQADTVIVPTFPSSLDVGFRTFSCYVHPVVYQVVVPRLLDAAFKHKDRYDLASKIFISRQDAGIRRVLNEDDVFSLFEPLGFKRYRLQDCSVIEQILLFAHADVIVSFQGTGLANSLFAKKDCTVIEIFQQLNDATFWYVSQDCGYSYLPVQTVPFLHDYVTAWRSDTYVDLEMVKPSVTFLSNFLEID